MPINRPYSGHFFLICIFLLVLVFKQCTRVIQKRMRIFFDNAVNLHALVMKSLLMLVRLFDCSQETYSMCYIVPTFVARQH